MARSIIFVAAVVLVALLLTGNLGGGPVGAPTTVSIAELHDNPVRWDGNPVQVTGQVSDRVAVLGYGGFTLRDQLGNEILVVGASTPAGVGQTTTVNGKFITAFAVRDIAMTVILVGAE
jgi:hypothetical protein